MFSLRFNEKHLEAIECCGEVVTYDPCLRISMSLKSSWCWGLNFYFSFITMFHLNWNRKIDKCQRAYSLLKKPNAKRCGIRDELERLRKTVEPAGGNRGPSLPSMWRHLKLPRFLNHHEDKPNFNYLRSPCCHGNKNRRSQGTLGGMKASP